MKFQSFSKLLLFLVALLITVQFLPAQVSAQTRYRGTVIRLAGQAEPYYDITLNPGDSYTGSFIIQHEYEDESRLVELYADATDFTVDSFTGSTIYPEGSYQLSGPYALANWVEFDQEKVTLTRYGEEQAVNFTVRVPENAAAGTRYANLIVSNAPEAVITGREQIEGVNSGAGIASRIVVATLLVTVTGDRSQSVSIESITVTGGDGELGLFGNVLNMHPVRIAARVKNAGNQGLLAGGDLFIHTGDNLNHIYTTQFNPDRLRVLPGMEREFIMQWNEAFVSWSREGGLEFDTSNALRLNWGRYFAEVNLLYKGLDGNLKVITKTVEFWVMPWKAIGVLLAAILIFIAYRMYKRRTTVKFVSGEPRYKTANKEQRDKGGRDTKQSRFNLGKRK